MPGTFDPANPPIRPGFYAIVRVTAERAVSGGSGGVVATGITHSWGPEGTVERITSSQEWKDNFGPDSNDQSFFVLGALEGGPSVGKAQAVLVTRMALSGNARASVSLSNGSTNAITLTGKYKGSFGNKLRATVRVHPVLSGYHQLQIINNDTLGVLESFDYVQTDITALAALINAQAQYITAGSVTSGTALTTVSNVAFTGGADGTATGTDYSTAMASLESQEYDIVAFPNLTDSVILASVRAWNNNVNTSIRRAVLLTGGTNGETSANANTRSALSSQDENVANTGYNVFIDNNTNTEYSSAQMLGFTAGMLAGAGVSSSLTYAQYPDRFSLKTTPNDATVKAAINAGTLLATGGSPQGTAKIELDVTTFTDKTQPTKPKAVFSRLSNVRVIHRIENDLTKLTQENWIGKSKNNATTRSSYLGDIKGYFKVLADSGAIEPGTYDAQFDESKDNTGDTLWLVYSVTIQKPITKVLAIGTVE